MKQKMFIALIVLFCFLKTSAQGLSIKILDSKSGDALPQATVHINDSETVVADGNGIVAIPSKYTPGETFLNVSYLGYVNATIKLSAVIASNNTIKLEPIAYQLQEVAVKNTNRNPDTIMAYVKRNLASNYRSTGIPTKNTLFFRRSTIYRPIQATAEMSKSTKVAKKDLDKVNADIKIFTERLIKHPPQEASDILADYYTGFKTIEGKRLYADKLMVKDALLYREDKLSDSPDAVEEQAMALLMSHLDSTKLYRLKSGLFGTRDTVIGHKEVKKENPKLYNAKSQVISFASKGNITYGYDFVTKPGAYEYTFEGVLPYEGDTHVYKINFKPGKRKAKYEGTLYISPTDYAILRADYQLAKGKVKNGLNLKFILGVKQMENISRGTLVYKQKARENSYYLQYANSEEGSYVYINRPLKFIEITDDTKEKVAYDFKVEGDIITKREYLNLSRDEITETEFNEAVEKEFTYTEPQVYNRKVWNKYVTDNPIEIIESLKKPK